MRATVSARLMNVWQTDDGRYKGEILVAGEGNTRSELATFWSDAGTVPGLTVDRDLSDVVLCDVELRVQRGDRGDAWLSVKLLRVGKARAAGEAAPAVRRAATNGDAAPKPPVTATA